jgi:hypothetical protein
MALLEAVYAVEPERYRQDMAAVLSKERDAKLFSLAAVYLYRADTSMAHVDSLKISLVERFPGYDTVAVLRELFNYLGDDGAQRRGETPPVAELLGAAKELGCKVIYSFQRWDRDYPGLAIVQYADGSFARNGEGRLEVFPQLARSGPGLPYFLTNGNTPQGVFSIQGTDVSHTKFIGPTPNLQLLMPWEGKWADYFHDTAEGGTGGGAMTGTGAGAMAGATVGAMAGATAGAGDTMGLQRYLGLLPAGWRAYTPMQEAFAAGAIGRTEIIAHGTTIDPEYYKGWPFYPLTPTMGCLCAKELWNPTSGHPLVSEQNNLVNAFLESGRAPKTAGRKPDGHPSQRGAGGPAGGSDGSRGYLIVVNVNDRREPVSRAEAEAWVRGYEKKNPR